MKKVLFATSNPSKVDRFKNGLLKENIELISLKDIEHNITVEENGHDAIENALIKAKSYYNLTKIITMAMDDNLFLEGVPKEFQPGMFVRRVNGKRLSDDEMLNYYINLVKKYGINGKLTAKWIYGMAIIKDGKEYTYTWSNEEFYLIDKPSKSHNQGYPLNSISINKTNGAYFSEIKDDDNSLSWKNEKKVIDFIVSIINRGK